MSNYTKAITATIIILFSVFIASFFGDLSINKHQELKIEAFNNSEILICYNTLIVSNFNWRLSGDNLINTNSAGYVELKNCKIKGE